MRCAQMEQFNDYWGEGHRQSRFALPNDPIKTRCWRRRRRGTDPSTLSLTELILNITSCIDSLIYDTNSTTTHSWEHTQVKNKTQRFLVFKRADGTVECIRSLIYGLTFKCAVRECVNQRIMRRQFIDADEWPKAEEQRNQLTYSRTFAILNIY